MNEWIVAVGHRALNGDESHKEFRMMTYRRLNHMSQLLVEILMASDVQVILKFSDGTVTLLFPEFYTSHRKNHLCIAIRT